MQPDTWCVLHVCVRLLSQQHASITHSADWHHSLIPVLSKCLCFKCVLCELGEHNVKTTSTTRQAADDKSAWCEFTLRSPHLFCQHAPCTSVTGSKHLSSVSLTLPYPPPHPKKNTKERRSQSPPPRPLTSAEEPRQPEPHQAAQEDQQDGHKVASSHRPDSVSKAVSDGDQASLQRNKPATQAAQHAQRVAQVITLG